MHDSIAHIYFGYLWQKSLVSELRLLIIVDYYTPHDNESWLLLLFFLIY
jgi:hypothetical protein